MRVLVFGAHPDDAELYCGGTLALCARRGDEISFVTVTDGSAGAGGGSDRDERAKSRRREAESAAAVIGARLVWLGERDLELFDSDRTRRLCVETVREVRPDLVLAHSPKDYHPDHRAVAKLALDACFISTVGGYDAGPPTDHRPVFYCMDAVAGIAGVPDEFVDISDVIDVKRKMFDEHASQGEVVETDAGKLWNVAEIQSRFRGAQCGVEHAEAFSHPEGWLRRVAKRVLP